MAKKNSKVPKHHSSVFDDESWLFDPRLRLEELKTIYENGVPAAI